MIKRLRGHLSPAIAISLSILLGVSGAQAANATTGVPQPAASFAVVPAALPAESLSGVDGTAEWTLSPEGVLTIDGGELAAYNSTAGWHIYQSEITKVIFSNPTKTVMPANSQDMFQGMSALIEFEGLGDIDTSGVTNFLNMFRDSRALESIDVARWDVSKGTTMGYMFQSASGLVSLDLSGWDTTGANLFSAFGAMSSLRVFTIGPKTSLQANSSLYGGPAGSPYTWMNIGEGTVEIPQQTWSGSATELMSRSRSGEHPGTYVVREPITLQFNANGDNVSNLPSSPPRAATGTAVTIPDQVPTRPGFTFSGWATTEDGGDVSYVPGQSTFLPGGTLPLYAQWVASPAAIVYNGNASRPDEPLAGGLDATEGVSGDTVVVSPNNFIRPGYSFTGWNTAADGSGTPYAAGDSIVMGLGVTVIYAQWEARPASFIYNGNGADSGSVSATEGVTHQEVTIAQNGFVRDGYSFGGWNTDPDGENGGDDFAPGAETELLPGTVELFAQWEADIASISYNGNGSTSGNMDPTEGVTDGDVEVAANDFERLGYTFMGWNSTEDGEGTSYSAGAMITLGAGVTTLYAQWSADQSTLNYNGNQAETGSMAQFVGVTDEETILADNEFERPGYQFVAWNSEADGSGYQYAAGYRFTLEPGGSTFYAQWRALPAAITYNGNQATGGYVTPTQGFTGQEVEVDNNGYDREGYEFAGWNTESDGAGEAIAAGASFTLRPGMTQLYAQWTALEATLVYDGNGANSGDLSPVVGLTGDFVALAQNPFTKPGFDFVGWSTSQRVLRTVYPAGSEFQLPAGITTVYATWQPVLVVDPETPPVDPEDPVDPETPPVDPEKPNTPGATDHGAAPSSPSASGLVNTGSGSASGLALAAALLLILGSAAFGWSRVRHVRGRE